MHVINYPSYTLCGSTKFQKEYENLYKALSLSGNIIYTVNGFGHSDEEFGSLIYSVPSRKAMCDVMHYAKIDDSVGIVVINKDGYIGESTAKEIEYVKRTCKDIVYLYEEGNILSKEIIKMIPDKQIAEVYLYPLGVLPNDQ